MYSRLLLFTPFLLFPIGVLSTPAPDPVAQVTPEQTIVPFSSLPPCALQCGFLYDAQGACTPPVRAASIDCFCNHGKLQPFYTGTAGVCDNACSTDPSGLTTIRSWFLGLCKAGAAAPSTSSSSSSSSAGPTATAPGQAGSGSSSDSGSSVGQAWLSSHYQYVIMIVIITFAIVFGWIGACLLKKRHDRRKEREFELRPPAAPWLVGDRGARKTPYGDGITSSQAGMQNKEADINAIATPASAVRFTPERKKWIVKERT